MRYGSTIRVDVSSVAFGGDGLGRVDGRVVFIPYTAVGDTVEAKVTEVHARHARAGGTAGIRVITPSLAREVPACQYYTRCGGCQYQHITYEEELRLKTRQVREAFVRIARLPEAEVHVRDIIPSPSAYEYRNRITVHAEGGHVGFRSADGRRLIDIDKCLIATPEVNAQLTALRKRHPQGGHYSLRAADIPRSAFHQANQLLLDRFCDEVVALLPAGTADTPAPRLCLELYSGGGFFTEKLAALGRFQHIWAVEQDERLVRDAVRKKIPGVTLCEGSVEDVAGPLLGSNGADTRAVAASVPLTTAEGAEANAATPPPRLIPAETLLLLDPPREGVSPQALANILRFGFAGIIYISCNPATLARDAAKIAQDYTLRVVQPVDMFPRTAQIECITVWEPKSGTQ